MRIGKRAVGVGGVCGGGGGGGRGQIAKKARGQQPERPHGIRQQEFGRT